MASLARTLGVLPVLAFLAVPACRPADDRGATEARLKAFLVEKLGNDARGINVTVVKGKATLTGEVKRRSTEELSKEVALAFPGIARVENEVELERGETVEQAIGGEVGDGRLEATVKGRLLEELGRRGFSIEVEAVDGVVSLRGTVPDEARRTLALQVARSVDGVTQLIDLVSIAN